MLRKALTIYAMYVCGCILFEIAERHSFAVAPLNEVRSIADAKARGTAEEIRAKQLDAMMESWPYIVYLFGTLAASVAVFIGGLFVMKKPLQPLAENPAAAHFIHLPLLLFPAIGCLAFMAPPWVIPFLIDGRSIAEMIEALKNVH
jgi:hypothetical protein